MAIGFYWAGGQGNTRSPFTYQASYRVPYIANGRSPFT